MGEIDLARCLPGRLHRRAFGFLEHDVLGCRVFANALEGRLAQELVRAPAPELNVGNEARFHPAHILERGLIDRPFEFGLGGFDGFQSAAQRQRRLVGEARTCPPGMHQLFFLIIAEHQRADGLA